MQVLEENETNWLVMTPDGSTDTKTKSSDLNKLLYGHNLWGLLDTGDEIWTHSGADGEPSVTIIPGETGDTYTIQVSGSVDLELSENRKTDLIGALQKVYGEQDGESVGPILNLYDEIRSNMMRKELLDNFLPAFGKKVQSRDDGWFINGHLLLTYEGEFFHPSTDSRKRSGGLVIGESSSTEAYSVSISNPEQHLNRNFTVDGEEYRLTTKEMRFLARVMWAIENTPERGE